MADHELPPWRSDVQPRSTTQSTIRRRPCGASGGRDDRSTRPAAPSVGNRSRHLRTVLASTWNWAVVASIAEDREQPDKQNRTRRMAPYSRHVIGTATTHVDAHTAIVSRTFGSCDRSVVFGGSSVPAGRGLSGIPVRGVMLCDAW